MHSPHRFFLYVFSNSPLYSIVLSRFSLHSLCSMYSPVFPCMHSSVFLCISVSHEFPCLPFPALSCSPRYIPAFPCGICCWQAYTDSLLLFCRCEGLHVDSLSMFRSNCCVLQQFSSVLLYDMIGSFFYKHFSAMADFGLNSISASVFSVTPILGDVWWQYGYYCEDFCFVIVLTAFRQSWLQIWCCFLYYVSFFPWLV